MLIFNQDFLKTRVLRPQRFLSAGGVILVIDYDWYMNIYWGVNYAERGKGVMILRGKNTKSKWIKSHHMSIGHR